MAQLTSKRGTGYERLDDDGAVPEDEGAFVRHDRPRSSMTAFSTDHVSAYDSKDQAYTIFWRQALRWLTTAVFLAASLATLKIYQDMGNVSRGQKNTFNSMITALLLLLGLNFFEAFKEVAKVLRWRILARGQHSIREIDLILGIEGLSNVIVLGWESIRKPLTLFFCFLWIVLNLLAQTSVALLSQTYSFDDGKDWNGTYVTKGVVNVPNLRCYFHYRGKDNSNPVCEDDAEITQGLAHIYGEQTSSSGCGPYKETSNILNSKNNYPYYCRRTPNRQEFAYRFSEFNPADTQKIYPSFSNRIITASAGHCFSYSEVLPHIMANDVNGNFAAWNFTYRNDSHVGSIVIPIANAAQGSTTYAYRDDDIPQKAIEYSCGPRCLWMWAHRDAGNNQSSEFFQCPITISPVSNTNNHSIYHVSDGIARLAAASIALEGRFGVVGENKTVIWEQFQYNPFGTYYEIHYKSPDEVGANMAEFAMKSLTTMINNNPPIQANGSLPHLGSRLTVVWPYAGALSAWILGIQFAIFAVVVRTAQVVVVKDDTHLSTARLLRPLVDDLGASGTLMSGRKISQALQGRREAAGLVYGPRPVKNSTDYDLAIGEDVLPRGRWPDRRHPDGVYR